jgi:hypothetical protein
VPPQHEAWAFLGLPLVLGATVSPASPLLLVLGVAWVAAYPLSYAALGLVRARRKDRFRRPFVVWLAVVASAVALLVLARPWLVWVGAAYLALFAVNVRYAQRNDERALVNDLVFIVECSAMVAVTWGVAVGGQSWAVPAVASAPAQVWVLVVVCALVLTGSTLHVKSLIRERRDPRYARASRTAALVSVGLSVGLAAWWGLPSGWWLVPPFAALAVRAFLVGRRPLRPGVIGMVELVGFVLVALGAAAAAAALP